MVEIRKIITTRETIFSELGVAAPQSVVPAVGMAVIVNPFAGRFANDLKPLFEAGAILGERRMRELVKLLDGAGRFLWQGRRRHRWRDGARRRLRSSDVRRADAGRN